MNTLKGRTAVISGAPEDVIREFIANGMNVCMITHMTSRADAFIETLSDEDKVRFMVSSNEIGDDNIFANIYERFGSVDVLIPNQGGSIRKDDGNMWDLTVEELMKKMKLIVYPNWSLVKAARPYLEKSKAGRIVLMTSAGAVNGYEDESIGDTIARAALISLTYRLARELGPKGVTVNVIAKGPVNGPHVNNDPALLDKMPVKHFGTDDEFRSLLCYLASEESGFITGQVINFNGGIVIG